MKTPKFDLDQALAPLKEVPPRDPARAEKGRVNFLAEVDAIISHPVSTEQNLRHTNWKNQISNLFQTRKELVPMFTQIISAILIAATLIAGGGGATVYASQNAMPGDMLYPVKTWSEETRLELTQNAMTQFDLNLEFANRRVEELISLEDEESGEVEDTDETPIRLMDRLQLHIEDALRLMDQVEDPELAMTRLQTHLRTQTKLLEDCLGSADPELEPVMLRTHQMLQDRLRLVDEELEPEQLQEQNQVQEQEQIQLGTQTQTGKPEEAGQGPNGPVETAQGTPGSGYGPGLEETPTPGGQYGPGPEVTSTPKYINQPTQAQPVQNEGDNDGGSGKSGGKGGK